MLIINYNAFYLDEGHKEFLSAAMITDSSLQADTIRTKIRVM